MRVFAVACALGMPVVAGVGCAEEGRDGGGGGFGGAGAELDRELEREERELEGEIEEEFEPEPEPEPEEEASECDPNYAGACLDPNASDYDCAGGSGDGPQYTGPVTVIGSDPYGLDSDGDGYACESG